MRWVHAIELADAARLLRGGELVLTTGIALPDEGALLDAYVADLAAVGVSALAVELGRRYTGGLPGGFVAAAEQHGLPLIVFDREVPFVEITEAVHARIIDDQLDQLRASARLHEVFTDLAVAGAGPAEIVRQAALLAGRPVILEDLSHHVLACEPAGADPAALLDGFEARSRAVAPAGRTAYDEPSGWLVTMAGARGEDWGRVILVCGQPPGAGDIVLVERTATALALARLLTRQHESLERQAHAHADRRDRGRCLHRPGRGGGAGQGAGGPGHRAAAADRGDQVPPAAGAGCPPTPGRERWPTRSPTRAAASGFPRWWARSTRPGSAACSRWTARRTPDQVLAAVCAATRQRLAGDGAVIGVGSAAASLDERAPVAARGAAGSGRRRAVAVGRPGPPLLPAGRPAAARPAAPAGRRRPAGHVRGPGTRPAAGP